MRRTRRTLNDCGIQHNAEVGLFTRPSELFYFYLEKYYSKYNCLACQLQHEVQNRITVDRKNWSMDLDVN